MTIWIIPYNRYSNGARQLSEATGYRRAITGRGVRRGDILINWGSSEIHFDRQQNHVLNDCSRTSVATNKLRFFQGCGDAVRTVPWTTDQGEATRWSTSGDVVARTVLTGHSGNGIIIIPQEGQIVRAPLYTQYVKSAMEFRVHVAFGEVIDVQRKIRDPSREPTNWSVRSHQNGFIYVREGFELPADARTQCLAAVCTHQLEFGAVDVITKKDGTAYVLEINCAPGMEGQTIQTYAQAFQRYFNGRQS